MFGIAKLSSKKFLENKNFKKEFLSIRICVRTRVVEKQKTKNKKQKTKTKNLLIRNRQLHESRFFPNFRYPPL